MKNDLKQGNYFLGLDVGTNSVGWAVTDEKYNIKNAKGKALWGIRLFEEAKSAEERRTNRTARRRLERRNYRLKILELLFNDEISKVDPLFFKRMHNSFLYAEDKESGLGKYTLFNDSNFNDKDYMKKYPTAYHLRSAIIHDEKSHDIRLVYLALHSIMKSRGHFLFESNNDSEYLKPIDAMNDLKTILLSEYDIDFVPKDEKKYLEILSNGKLNITNKKKLLNEAYGSLFSESDAKVDIKSINNMLAGAKVKLSDLFLGYTLKENDINSLALSDNFDEVIDSLQKDLGDKLNLIEQLKILYDCAKLSQILDKFEYLSDAKVEQFNQNKSDLSKLKKYVRKYANDKYDEIFKLSKDNLNNYVAYNGIKKESGAYSCLQQSDFCAYLKNVLKPLHNDDKEYSEICQKILDNTFIPKLRGNENSIVPYQLHKKELIKILDNASKYLDFLNFVDTDGTCVKDKIIDTFEFKVPYYVGPLNKNSANSWVIRKDEKITPWNFSNTVNMEESAKGFMTKLIGRCTYTGEDVLPKDSLLYSEYSVLNEINKIKVNGNPITVKQKKLIYEELFVNSNKKVTKESIRKNLIKHGMPKADEITGVDDVIKSNLKSLHDFKTILNKYHDENMVEDLIQSILILGQDKKMLHKYIKSNYKVLAEEDIKYVCKLKYSEWGRLSKTLLTEIYTPNDVGEAINIITMLRETNNNLMELLSSEKYKFLENINNYVSESKKNNKTLDEKLDELYISPAVRRSIRQTLKIIDEIVKVEKSVPQKIFIEVARGEEKEKQGKRTKSRKEQLVELYKACKEESNPLFAALESEDDSNLRRDKLYLYYTQFGKCMYSGEPIDISDLGDDNKYDIDHVFPQSRIMDDSIDNRVLVKKQLNEVKGNIYPISEDIRNKMYSFWCSLYEKNLISQKKLNRLVRNSPLTVNELSEFVSRQLTETQQSTKALATLLKELYPKELYPELQIVYSKAKNVSEFRHKYDIIKCRDINDLHHAKDAYLNIVVGNVFHTKFTESFFKNIESLAKNNEYSLNKIFDFSTQGAWDKDKSIATVKKYMNKNNILFTRMPYMAKGPLFDLTIMPKGKGQLPIKQNLSIEKYGGYNKIAGCAFFVVEHTKKKKRIRTIEPIYLYKKDLFLNNPQKYCLEVLKLDNPKVTSGIIRIDSLLELDGIRLHIISRSGNNIHYKHGYQFATNQNNDKYIKCVSKYVKRYDDIKNPPNKFNKFDGLSRESNIKLYDEFIERLRNGIYGRLTNTMLNSIENLRNNFLQASNLEQCKTLMEVVKFLKCDATHPKFNMIGGGETGIVRFNKNISNLKSLYLIHQSTTGIFETKIDLLT